MENTFSLIDSTGIEVQFHYQYYAESGERSADGYLRYGDATHFLYQLGEKTVFAVDSVWKTYDATTNQVFIHEPDIQFQQMVLKWLNRDSLLTVEKIHQINSRAYTVQLSDEMSPFDVYFSDQQTLDQIIVYGHDYSLVITVKSLNPIAPEQKDPFKLDLPHAFELDLRE
ncbi:MAG: hypothetical protein GXO91_07140 [FCB group bacterium]|nr:hypothetical protein [FCB group bacterium]